MQIMDSEINYNKLSSSAKRFFLRVLKSRTKVALEWIKNPIEEATPTGFE